MKNIIFIEGVSGVGKSTMVRMLSDELRSQGYNVKSYPEFDYTNPIDFYAVAYFNSDEYENFCNKYISSIDSIIKNHCPQLKHFLSTAEYKKIQK